LIETERLLLRRFTDADRETVARWNADPEFTRYLAGVQTRAQSDEAFDRWQRHWAEHGAGLLAVVWRPTGELIGRVGPQYHRMWPDDPEVGWALDPAWWGKGIATEAGRASVDWAFGELGYARLVSITTDPNIASRNVMSKLGFELHARIPSEWGVLLVHMLQAPAG
jgi:RimJ/RimL family protein N-acetyltransferase